MTYHDTLSCIAILQGINYSLLVTVILEYVDLILVIEYLWQCHAFPGSFYCY